MSRSGFSRHSKLKYSLRLLTNQTPLVIAAVRAYSMWDFFLVTPGALRQFGRLHFLFCPSVIPAGSGFFLLWYCHLFSPIPSIIFYCFSESLSISFFNSAKESSLGSTNSVSQSHSATFRSCPHTGHNP